MSFLFMFNWAKQVVRPLGRGPRRSAELEIWVRNRNIYCEVLYIYAGLI